MLNLLGRLSALDPSAENDVRVIQPFDTLIKDKRRLSAVIRAAAVLAGCPAGLADPERRVTLRIGPDGVVMPAVSAADPPWPSEGLCEGGGTAQVWLERAGQLSATDAMIMERMAVCCRIVLQRTRGRPVAAAADPANVEVLVYPTADRDLRSDAARSVGLKRGQRMRVAFLIPAAPAADGAWAQWKHVKSAAGLLADRVTAFRWHASVGPAEAVIVPPEARRELAEIEGIRCGVATLVDVLDLPASAAAARAALRLTADGSTSNPGPMRVEYDLGPLAAIVEHLSARDAFVPDVRTLDEVAAVHSWAIPTLAALAEHDSVRGASNELACTVLRFNRGSRCWRPSSGTAW